MHRMISAKQAAMTRFVTLKNKDTGTIDYCFDDSDFPDSEKAGFYFMEEGKNYDCKILLFGDAEPGPGGVAQKALCRVVRDNIICGEARLVEVLVDGDRYYVPRNDVIEQLRNGEFYYYYTRKDLIQVDHVIHGDYLD